MAKPDCAITSDSKCLTIKTENILKTWERSLKELHLTAEKLECLQLYNWYTVQHQEWDEKSTIRRAEGKKSIMECVMNNITCTRIYEKV